MEEFEPNQPIIQRHIRRLIGLEESQARIILKLYQDAMNKLRNKLLSARDNSFTEARLKTTMAQIDTFIKVLENLVNNEIDDSYNFAFEQGVEDSVSEINKFEKDFTGIAQVVPIDPIIKSVDRRNILLNNFVASINAYNVDIRTEMQRQLSQALIQGKNYTQTVNDLDQVLNRSLWKAHRIVRTEMHQIYNVSKLDGMKEIKKDYVPDLMKMLMHVMDLRTGQDSIQLAAENPIIPIEKPFTQEFQGKKYVFMTPPNRPNDRAILIPVRAKYERKSNIIKNKRK